MGEGFLRQTFETPGGGSAEQGDQLALGRTFRQHVQFVAEAETELVDRPEAQAAKQIAVWEIIKRSPFRSVPDG